MCWEVVCGKDKMRSAGAEKAIGVVTNNTALVRDLVNSPKSSYRLVFEDRFRRCHLGEMKLSNYRYQCVLSPRYVDIPPGAIFEPAGMEINE
jgi:hypothetical protein